MLLGDKLGEQAPGVGEIVMTKKGRAPWAGSGLRGIRDAVELELGRERSKTGARGRGEEPSGRGHSIQWDLAHCQAV